MCGIIGFCGNGTAPRHVVDGLIELEYRGYDSAGIALVMPHGLEIHKGTGRIRDIEGRLGLTRLEADTALGHTRWASHGGATSDNAHPHKDTSGTIAVVHNGIVENHQDLRTELVRKGVVFESETDTEVLPHLIARQLETGAPTLESAIAQVCPRLRGPYAFAAASSVEPGKLVCARRDNSLVIGCCRDGNCICSDAIALPSAADTMIVLQNNQIAVVTPDSVRVLDEDLNEHEVTRVALDRTWADTRKNGHRHYMLKEIVEQPEALLRTARQDERLITDIALEILRAQKTVFMACGSSRHASLIGRLLFANIARRMSEVVVASEFGPMGRAVDRNTVAIAVSQSGETADVLDGVRMSKATGAHVVAIVNRPVSVLADESDAVLRLNCGAEIGVAATKTFLCQLGLFYLLAHSMRNRLAEAQEEIRQTAIVLSDAMKAIDIQTEHAMRRLVHKEDFYYLGRGANFPLALEGALKMKEIPYVHAEGMPAGELKHGALALITEGTPVVVVCPNDDTYAATMTNAIEAKSRGAHIIAVSDIESDIYDTWLRIPTVAPHLYPLVAAVPLQYMAYHMAVLLGCDPDRPRNLAKSVTVR